SNCCWPTAIASARSAPPTLFCTAKTNSDEVARPATIITTIEMQVSIKVKPRWPWSACLPLRAVLFRRLSFISASSSLPLQNHDYRYHFRTAAGAKGDGVNADRLLRLDRERCGTARADRLIAPRRYLKIGRFARCAGN